MIYLLNDFDIDMGNCFFTMRRISLEEAKQILFLNEYTSLVWDADVAPIMEAQLDIPVPVVQKQKVTFNQGDRYLIFQKGRWCLIDHNY